MEEVTSAVWRGSRPGPADFATIKQKFRVVISLEGPEEDHKEALELAPTPVLSFPISTWQILVTGVSQDYLTRILQSMFTAYVPALVHCREGRDRTGLVIAAYRVRYCAWDKKKAMDEAIAHGYRHQINFGLNRTWADVKEQPF